MGKVGKLLIGISVSILIILLLRFEFIPIFNGDKTLSAFSDGDGSRPDFAAIYDINSRKRAFFGYMAPLVKSQNAIIHVERTYILGLLDKFNQQIELNKNEKHRLQEIALKYKVSLKQLDEALFNQLLNRVDIVPISMVLIQAANESGWGTSRFATKGNNYFGQWCFSAGCGLVPNQRSSGLSHEVAKFASPEASVAAYMKNINSHNAYDALRQIRANLRSQDKPIEASALFAGLIDYSERGQAYIDELTEMLHYNQKLIDEVKHATPSRRDAVSNH